MAMAGPVIHASRGSVTLESARGSDTGLMLALRSSFHSQVSVLSLANRKRINVCTNSQPISQHALDAQEALHLPHSSFGFEKQSHAGQTLVSPVPVNTAEVPVEYKHINWFTSTFNNTGKMISSLFYDNIPFSIHLKYLYYAKCSSFCLETSYNIFTLLFSDNIIISFLRHDSFEDSVSLSPSFT